MKILIVHSHYQYKGGEEFVIEQESLLLQESYQVETLIYYNKSGWRGGRQFFASIWNFSSITKLKSKIQEFQPDIVHFHNTHYATGPAVIRLVNKLNIPIVITFHNYRLLCPSGTLLFKNKIFLNSLKQDFPWNAILKKVFRNSLTQTFWSAFVFWFHKKIGTWNKAGAIIVMTDFAKTLYSKSNLNINSDKFHVKPNFVPIPELIETTQNEDFLYVGRLSIEKGIDVLLEAFSRSGHKLRIAGTGQLKAKVEHYSKCYKNITYLGNLSKKEIFYEMQQCTALIFPSIWYETFGLVLIEALSLKCAVIASDIGSPKQIIEHKYNGLHFTANNQDSLIQYLNYWNNLSSNQKSEYRNNALSTYQKYYTPIKNINKLTKIYESLLLEADNKSI